MRYDVDVKTRKSIREIVDGQQRISAILSYVNDGFKILNVHNKEFGNLYFSELSESEQKKLWEYKISVDVLKIVDDPQILDIFARLNTYTVVLKKQELLNAKYFGAFKQTVYSIGFNFKEFYVNNGILTEKQIARMAEAELTSELIIIILSGIEDRKNIEQYYKKFDDEFAKEGEVRKTFASNIDIISQIIGPDLLGSSFSKTPIFYSLFGVVNELKKERKFKEKYFSKIREALLDIDVILDTDPNDLPQNYFAFYDAATKHVTDLKSRKIRHEFIKNHILGKALN